MSANKKPKLGALVSLLVVCGISCNAAVLIQHVSFAGANRADITGTAGMRFTVEANSIAVSALGAQDLRIPSPPVSIGEPPPLTPPPDGLQVSHQVGIWTTNGTLLGSVVVLAGTSSTQSDTAWRYENLAQTIVLEAGETYVLGAQLTQGFDPVTDNGLDPFAFSLSSDIIGLANVLSSGSFQMPSVVQAGGVPRWAPANLRYEVVPEPGTLALICICSSSVLMRRRKR